MTVNCILQEHAHETAKHFSYGKARERLSTVADSIDAGPNVQLQLDKNGTRIAAAHGLLNSMIRMNKAVKMYALQYKDTIKASDDEWREWNEVEAVLECTRPTTKLAQVEKVSVCQLYSLPCLSAVFTRVIFGSITKVNCIHCQQHCGAYANLIKRTTLGMLRDDVLHVIDTENITKKLPLPRHAEEINNLTSVGLETRFRATLEGASRGRLSFLFIFSSCPLY